jgi:hypothetical protein
MLFQEHPILERPIRALQQEEAGQNRFRHSRRRFPLTRSEGGIEVCKLRP